jgi:hypothetical protein
MTSAVTADGRARVLAVYSRSLAAARARTPATQQGLAESSTVSASLAAQARLQRVSGQSI